MYYDTVSLRSFKQSSGTSLLRGPRRVLGSKWSRVQSTRGVKQRRLFCARKKRAEVIFDEHSYWTCRPLTHLPLFSLLQIDWPAPQDKKRECVAKGKNNQVTCLGWLGGAGRGSPALLQGTEAVGLFKTVVYENYILVESVCDLETWKPSSHYISTQRAGLRQMGISNFLHKENLK